MTLVNDRGRDQGDPGTDVQDYRSWRRLAVALRQSVIKNAQPGGVGWLKAWSDTDSLIGRALVLAKSDPDIDEQHFPKVPKAGIALAAGAASVFTAKIPELVAYVRQGDALVPEGEGTRAVGLARTRESKGDLEVRGPTIGRAVLTTVLAGLVLYGVTEAIAKVRRTGE